jgi:AcrR family transcriptional regulator
MPQDTFYNLPEEKRNRILNLSIEEFAAHPYNVASISNIVRKAGIAKGSFYQYFEDKKDLYKYLVISSIDEKMKLVKDIPQPDLQSGLFGYMRWQFLSEVFFEIRHPELAQIAYRAFVEGVPFPDIREELKRRGTTQFFKQLISQGIHHDEVAVWVDPDVAAFLMEVLFYQFGKYFIERLGLTEKDFENMSILENQEAQQLLSNLMDILEAGIKSHPEQRENLLNNL